ncbi:MAG: hypothetical protein AMXMBFR66_13730 [Pseudomonadota bacterium]
MVPALHASPNADAAGCACALPVAQATRLVFDAADHAPSRSDLQAIGEVRARLSNTAAPAFAVRVVALEGGRAAAIAEPDRPLHGALR